MDGESLGPTGPTWNYGVTGPTWNYGVTADDEKKSTSHYRVAPRFTIKCECSVGYDHHTIYTDDPNAPKYEWA